MPKEKGATATTSYPELVLDVNNDDWKVKPGQYSTLVHEVLQVAYRAAVKKERSTNSVRPSDMLSNITAQHICVYMKEFGKRQNNFLCTCMCSFQISRLRTDSVQNHQQ